jgi:hypothetical protein
MPRGNPCGFDNDWRTRRQELFRDGHKIESEIKLKSSQNCMNRPMTSAEKNLIRWMLEHGEPEAKNFFHQLEKAEVTPWRCQCGCASINFLIQGHPAPSGGLHPLADFVFGNDENLSGIFVYEQNGVLAGLEVYGLAGDAPKLLPLSESLRPFRQD